MVSKSKVNKNITICILFFLLLISVVLIYMLTKKPIKEKMDDNTPNITIEEYEDTVENKNIFEKIYDGYIIRYIDDKYISSLYETHYGDYNNNTFPPVSHTNDKTFMESKIDKKVESIKDGIKKIMDKNLIYTKKYRIDETSLMDYCKYKLKTEFFNFMKKKNNNEHKYIFGKINVDGESKYVSDYYSSIKTQIDKGSGILYFIKNNIFAIDMYNDKVKRKCEMEVVWNGDIYYEDRAPKALKPSLTLSKAYEFPSQIIKLEKTITTNFGDSYGIIVIEYIKTKLRDRGGNYNILVEKWDEIRDETNVPLNLKQKPISINNIKPS